MTDEEPSLNIPSLLTLAVVSFFVIRWFFNRDSGADGARPGEALGRTRRRVDPAHVEQISQMFPQLNRRDIMWDLQRNGGSMAATTERILTGRGLEVPPPSFQPQIPVPTTSTATTQNPSASGSSAKPQAQDLISRYNLASKIASENDRDSSETSPSADSAWSQSKSERQRLLQKRRDEMILAARRKLQQKDKETMSTPVSSSS
ncbi:hypothetical protein DTO021D3_3560 [Paecilomyces variotii]|nr:hypothetical protein DTO032I3_6000 [Paecilomyces variotii]KAJ9279433.1 hypothetical protein DTO021D3_3560 [Paecilomyces variotii]KAJ9342737.1 hypothetical protein DTO027B6_4608 [Paecilomyces variotii]KAJ9347850.1 hypothetical protein DTO027B9_8813 [Paecilomyces variotii]KAJ9383937.1 hypothetical protein DTO032I4_4810 [Paecilomyces variotii]